MIEILIIILILVSILNFAFYVFNSKSVNKREILRLESKIDLILKSSGITYNPIDSLSPKVQTFLEQGQQIEAIKQYRIETGLGLRDAKQAIQQAGTLLKTNQKTQH